MNKILCKSELIFFFKFCVNCNYALLNQRPCYWLSSNIAMLLVVVKQCSLVKFFTWLMLIWIVFMQESLPVSNESGLRLYLKVIFFQSSPVSFFFLHLVIRTRTNIWKIDQKYFPSLFVLPSLLIQQFVLFSPPVDCQFNQAIKILKDQDSPISE